MYLKVFLRESALICGSPEGRKCLTGRTSCCGCCCSLIQEGLLPSEDQWEDKNPLVGEETLN